MDVVEGSDAWKAQDKGPAIVTACWAVTALSTVFVAARIYVQGGLMKKFKSDDICVILALICGYISTGLSTVAVRYGNGKHFSLLTTEQQEYTILYTTAAFCPGVISFGLPKLAVVILLTRLLNPSRYHKWFIWWLGIWCMLTLFATCGVLLGQCTPTNSLWNFSVEGKCFSKTILVGYCIYAGAFSAFVDIYLAVYPTIVLYKLQITTSKKLALCGALGIGSISGVVAIYKTTRIPSLASADFSYDTSDLVVWTVIEGSTIIIACSIPLLRPLLELVLKRNPFSSNRATGSESAARYYGGSRFTKGSAIELKDHKVKSARDNFGFTVADGNSQESILAPEQNAVDVLATSKGSPETQKQGAIMKTFEVDVSVSYSSTSTEPADATGSHRQW